MSAVRVEALIGKKNKASPSIPRIMHDEVSETENIRKNLAIERMIVEGCEILLDTSQTFVRQGNRASVHPPASARNKRAPAAQISRDKIIYKYQRRNRQ